MLTNTLLAKVTHFRNLFLSLFLFISAVILLPYFSTNAFGQITIPLSQLNPKLTKNINGEINTIKLIDGRLYIGTEKGVWIVSNDNSEAVEVESIKENVSLISKFDDQVIASTNKDLWFIGKDGTAKKAEGIEGEYNRHQVVGRHVFVTTEEGLWIVGKDGTAKEVKKLKERIGSIQAIGDEVIATTFSGSWLVNEDGEATIFQIGTYPVRDIDTGEGTIEWGYGVMGGGEAILIVPGVVIQSKLMSSGWWGEFISSILPSNWLPVGKVPAIAFYSDKDGNDIPAIAFHTDKNSNINYNSALPNKFRFAKAYGDKIPDDDKFSPQEQFTYEIGWGKNEVHYWVINTVGGDVIHAREIHGTYYGVPSQYFIAVFPFILSVVFVLGCFALAPKVSFCHSAIMNPWLRKYFSLGSVPLLLSVFPSLRRYVLRQYSNSINNDKEFTEWKMRFIYPDEEFRPENFGKILESERKLLLMGQSGIGKTSFFKHLTANYASLNKPSLPAKVFPVYIPLTNYGGNSLEDLVYNQLFSYGKITDKELAPMFLEQGRLLIFLDGVNEVQNVADRQKLSEFVERFRASNYICLSSQQSYPEIENIPKVELKSFSPEKVCEFIRQRVNDKENAENVIKKLTNENYQLYSVPRDLEFTIEILNSGEKSLPKSRTELYKITFSSIFSKWKENGALEAEDNLCKHAYTMIVQRDLAFDSVDNPIFKEITTDLFEQKFLVRREKNYNFRHDLIRSYLASEYFYPRWKNLFEQLNGKLIDSNWLEMLKFSCENIEDSNEVRSLVYEVLEKSVRKDLVKQLFEWLKANHPSKCKSWENNFYAKYGELDFKRV